MPTEPAVVVRPVVPQDRIASASLAVLGVLAFLVALPVWEEPLLGALAVLIPVVCVGVATKLRPFGTARRWLGEIAQVPHDQAVVGDPRAAARFGLLLGGSAGLVLLLVVVGVVAAFGSASGVVVLLALVPGLAVERFLAAHAVRGWEREHHVLLCRRPAATRLVLLHETDLERMVVVPLAR